MPNQPEEWWLHEKYCEVVVGTMACPIYDIPAIIAETERRTWDEAKKLVAEEALQYEAELEENIGYVSIKAEVKAEELRHLQSLINSRIQQYGK